MICLRLAAQFFIVTDMHMADSRAQSEVCERMAEIKDKAGVMAMFSSLFMTSTCELSKQFPLFSILVLNPILVDLFLWSCFFMLSMLQLLSNDPFASVHYQSLVSVF